MQKKISSLLVTSPFNSGGSTACTRILVLIRVSLLLVSETSTLFLLRTLLHCHYHQNSVLLLLHKLIHIYTMKLKREIIKSVSQQKTSAQSMEWNSTVCNMGFARTVIVTKVKKLLSSLFASMMNPTVL